MTKQINPSWEKKKEDIHSPLGVEDLRRDISYALKRFYTGLAESMFPLEMNDSDKEKYQDMLLMSRDTVPEKFLLKNGECTFFEIGDQVHCLPFAYQGGLNIYGYQVEWHPIPTGWVLGKDKVMDRIHDMKLNETNSVIMRNDLFGGNDEHMIDAMIKELVDNMLTLNQLQLLAKCPFIFNVSEDNMLSAKQYFLSLSTDRPAIFTNALGENVDPITNDTYHPIDPTLLELLDRWESELLKYLGFDIVPISKRAQQSVAEVASSGGTTHVRRQEKYQQRAIAWERINKMFGTNVKVHSLLDEYNDARDEIAETDGKMNNDNAVQKDKVE